MPNLTTFADFLKATKVHKITSATEILNDAVKNSYMMGEMTRGMADAEIVRTGQSIKDDIQLTDTGTFQFYSPNPTFNVSDLDVLSETAQNWRFGVSYYGFNDETMDLNGEAGEDTFVNLKYSKRQAAFTDMWNGMENALWAVPVAATMEGTGASSDTPPAMSIPAFVNEGTNGLFPGFTTVEGLNPATETRWVPQQSTYDSTDVASEASGILAAFDEMWLKVNFESPDGGSSYFENDRLRKMKIISNLDGIKIYKRLLRAGNDRFVSPQDPAYQSPEYAGIPLKYISTLNTQTLEITGGTTASGIAYPTGKPRYFWLNLAYLFPIFHAQAYMKEMDPISGGINMPFSHAVFFRTWYNLFCRSRQRQGIVYPAA